MSPSVNEVVKNEVRAPTIAEVLRATAEKRQRETLSQTNGYFKELELFDFSPWKGVFLQNMLQSARQGKVSATLEIDLSDIPSFKQVVNDSKTLDYLLENALYFYDCLGDHIIQSGNFFLLQMGHVTDLPVFEKASETKKGLRGKVVKGNVVIDGSCWKKGGDFLKVEFRAYF